MASEAANRWTDNIFACKSYLTKKRGMSGKEADQVREGGVGSGLQAANGDL